MEAAVYEAVGKNFQTAIPKGKVSGVMGDLHFEDRKRATTTGDED